MPTTAELDQIIRAQAETIAALTARIQLLEDAQRPSSTSSIESSLSALTEIQTDQQAIFKDVLDSSAPLTKPLSTEPNAVHSLIFPDPTIQSSEYSNRFPVPSATMIPITPVLITISPSCPPSPLVSTPLFHILPSQLFSSYTTIKPDIPLSISMTCIPDKLSIFRSVPYDNHCAQSTIPLPRLWPTFLTSCIEFSIRPLPWPNILISFLELCRLPLKSQFCLLSHASRL